MGRALVAAAATSTALTACTGGVNAGEDGGIAFILLVVTLIVGCAILWFILGREE